MNKRRNAMIRVEIMIVLYYSGPMNSRNLIARIAVRYGVPKQVVCGILSGMKKLNTIGINGHVVWLKATRNVIIRKIIIDVLLYCRGLIYSRYLINNLAQLFHVPKQVVCGNLSFMKRQNQVHFTPKPSFVYI